MYKPKAQTPSIRDGPDVGLVSFQAPKARLSSSLLTGTGEDHITLCLSVVPPYFQICENLFLLVRGTIARPAGIEPATWCLEGTRSIH